MMIGIGALASYHYLSLTFVHTGISVNKLNNEIKSVLLF